MPASIPSSLLFALALSASTRAIEPSNSHLVASRGSRSSFPKLDIQGGCRNIANMEINRTTNYDGCVKEEETARTELAKVWGNYSASMHGQCLHLVTPPAIPSYVTLQECLNIAHDALNLSKSDPAKGLPGLENIR